MGCIFVVIYTKNSKSGPENGGSAYLLTVVSFLLSSYIFSVIVKTC